MARMAVDARLLLKQRGTSIHPQEGPSLTQDQTVKRGPLISLAAWRSRDRLSVVRGWNRLGSRRPRPGAGNVIINPGLVVPIQWYWCSRQALSGP